MTMLAVAVFVAGLALGASVTGLVVIWVRWFRWGRVEDVAPFQRSPVQLRVVRHEEDSL